MGAGTKIGTAADRDTGLEAARHKQQVRGMGARTQSFAHRIRQAIHQLHAEGRELTTTNIANQADLKTFKESKRMGSVLSDLYKAGEVDRVRRGVYVLKDRRRPEEKRQVMWRILRMRRRVTVDDLIEMAGVSRDYAREWLRALTKRGVTRKITIRKDKPRVWQLVNDTVSMPDLADNADKLRELRRKKKAALAALDQADILIQAARREIEEIGGENDGC